MTLLRWLHLRLLAIASIAAGCAPAAASPVAIESVQVTFPESREQTLAEVVDGLDVGRAGWSVGPRIGEAHAAIFRTRSPVEVETCEVTLCFLSGRPASYFDEFTLSATTDPNPTLESVWEPLTPVRFSATGPEINFRDDGRFTATAPASEFRITGLASDAVFQIGVRMPAGAITAFRVDVFPRERPASKRGPTVSPSGTGDFVLTEFRLEAAESRTTNIALGRPVKASHPLWGPFTPGMLTDGLPGTIAHPIQPDLGAEFFFEIDLGSVRTLDHIALRNRGDNSVPERLSRVKIELFEDDPGAGAAPIWTGRLRTDGTHSRPGEVDVIHASAGTGEFRGRYLRIRSESPIAFSPQIAEVEVYEKLTPQLASVRLDDHEPHTPHVVQVPAGTRWIEVIVDLPRTGAPDDLQCRWRLRGFHSDWQLANGFSIGIPPPPPGAYTFEAQVRHTDREWDSSVLTLALEMDAHFWQTRVFRHALIVAALAALALAVRYVTRRRLARRMSALEAKAALDEERARIARDMHDEVGARLSQLAILQEIFGREYALPDSAQAGLRQLTDTAREAVASLDEVVWMVNPRNDTLASLAEYLSQCATGYLAPLEIACRIDAPLDWPAIEIHAQTRHNIVLAMKEALQNVAKHSRATEVSLSLRYDPPHFFARLADNGRGLPADADGPGKDGLANMHARLAAIGGTCSVRSLPEGGTEVEMRAPLHAETLAASL
jgi:signal transduction histidine kinase